MTEWNASRPKRVGVKCFKNPPQPHMCIQDYLRGSVNPCYINVLSWDKVGMAMCSFDRLPLYGGMRITPPRTEKPDIAVFSVMTNSEVLTTHGKNAPDLKDQYILIELILDFVETMNNGIFFARQYKILNDRDITGELKEIWMIVQSERAKALNETTVEEVKRPVPQYPQYQDQCDQPKQLPPPQNYQPQYSPRQQHPHQQPQQYRHHKLIDPQQPLQMQNDEMSHPPQYHSDSPDYSASYQGQLVYRLPKKYPNTPINQAPPLPQIYPMPQYQFQQMPRPVGPPYNPNIPNANLACQPMPNHRLAIPNNTLMTNGPQIHYDQYVPMMENDANTRLRRNLQQPQQQRSPKSIVHRPTSYNMYSRQVYPENVSTYGPVTNIAHKSSSNKSQSNSPTHGTDRDGAIKSLSPVKVLQRDSVQLPHDILQEVTTEKKRIQVTDLDQDEWKNEAVDAEKSSEIPEDAVQNREAEKSTVSEQKKIVVLKRSEGVMAHGPINVKCSTHDEPETPQEIKADVKLEEKLDEQTNLMGDSPKNGYIDAQRTDDGNKLVKTFANTLKNVLTVNPSTSDPPEPNLRRVKMNGQVKNNSKDSEKDVDLYTMITWHYRSRKHCSDIDKGVHRSKQA